MAKSSMAKIQDQIRHAIALSYNKPVEDALIFRTLPLTVSQYFRKCAKEEIVLNRETCTIRTEPYWSYNGSPRTYGPEIVHLTTWMLDNGYRMPETDDEWDVAKDPTFIPCDPNELTTDLIGYASVNAEGIRMCEEWRKTHTQTAKVKR